MTIQIHTAIRDNPLQDIEYRKAYGSALLKYDLAHALVEARKSQHLSQKELAEICGVSQAYIAKLESGEANPTIGQIGAILAAVGMRAQVTVMELADPQIEVR